MIDTTQVLNPEQKTFSEISELISALSNGPLSFNRLDRGILRLEELVFDSDDFDAEKAEQFFNGIPSQIQQRLINNYCEWETEIENEFAADLVSGKATDYKDYRLHDRFFRLLSKEVALVKSYDFERILFIGSGPFPITAILLHVMTGKVVECLECFEPSAVESRKALKRLNLEDKIIVHVGDGSSFNMQPYDLILNALLAKPKWDIMKNIKATGRKDCLVLCRTSFGLRRVLYEETPDHAVKGFLIKGTQTATYDDTISTWLLRSASSVIDDLKFEWKDKLTDDDITRIVDMQNRILVTDNNNGFTGRRLSSEYYFNRLQSDVNAGLKTVLLIRDNDRVYGQMILARFLQDSYSHRAEVTTLMIEKFVRGGLVSIKVAEALLEQCENLDISLLTIDVRKGSKPESLWKYLGFVPFGELPSYSRIDNDEYKGVFMYQEVSELKKTLVKRLSRILGSDQEAEL